ncbi:MAG: GNAT family N-acetyltransferase [Anaerolineae bacterium]
MMISTGLPEGFSARPATLDDADAVVELINACSIADRGHPTTDLSEIRNDWISPYCDPQTNARLVYDGKELVGCASLWTEPPCVTIYASVRVHPDDKGRGVGTYLARWAAARAWKAAVSVAPENARIAIHQFRPATDADSRGLLLSEGYQDVRHGYRMLIELENPPPSPRFPDGIVMRTFDRERHMRALVRAEQEIFRDHWGYVELPFEQDLAAWEQWIDNDEHHDPSIWFLAMRGEDIAGVCLCRSFMVEDPEMGYVSSLGVARRWRRRGIGLAMLHHAFGEFHRRGKKRVSLDVDADSLTGATRLYEKAGMHVQRESVTYELVLREGEDLTTQELG